MAKNILKTTNDLRIRDYIMLCLSTFPSFALDPVLDYSIFPLRNQTTPDWYLKTKDDAIV